MNVGLCVYGLPDLFTSFFSDSVIKWVQIIVESDGKIGDVGTGMGRVEFSICKTIDEEPTQPSEQEGYEVNAYPDMVERNYSVSQKSDLTLFLSFSRVLERTQRNFKSSLTYTGHPV